MNPIDATFRFADVSLAQTLLESSPPEGIRISEDESLVCGDASLGLDTSIRVIIEIKGAIIPLAVAVTWLVTQLKQRGNKQGRINDQDVHLEEPDILRLIEDERRKQAARDAQWARDHNKLQ